MVGLVPLEEEEETPELFLAILRGHGEKMTIYKPESGFSPGTESAGTLILDFQAPEL